MARLPNRRFRRVYWDSCTWISLIQNEIAVPLSDGGGVENRAALARPIINDAAKGVVEILTSSLTFPEVSKPSQSSDNFADSVEKLAAFFENDFITVVMLDRTVGEMARTLMQQGHSGLRPLDAVHIASAMTANADEMHTFDDKLLRISERMVRKDGKPLKICKPSLGGPFLPLLDPPPEALDDNPSEAGDDP